MTEVMRPMVDFARRLAIEDVPSDYENHEFMIADLECVNRVTHLPVVASVLNYGRNVYESAKESRVPLLKTALEAAETVAKSAVHQVQPVADFLEGPIHLVDSLTCKGLDVLEDAVPGVKLTPEEMVKQAKSYVAAKVQPTAELFSVAKEIGGEAAHQGQIMMERGATAAGTAAGVAAQAAEIGVSAASSAVDYGMERASEAMDLGLETASKTVDIGLEQAGKAVGFGKEKALQAARTKYGQMAVKGIDKAAVMADTLAEQYMPPELVQRTRKLGGTRLRQFAAEPTDVAKATEQWEPELRPVGHAVATGENLFKKLLAVIFWQLDLFKSMVAAFFMPLLHPFKFADFVLTQTFKFPPRIFNFWKTVFNIAMAFAPWNLAYTMMNVAKWSQNTFTNVAGGIIRFIYFHYVPDDVIEAIRQTRVKLEQTKWAPPNLGESLPKGKHAEESEGGSGYVSEEHPPSPVRESTPKKHKEDLERGPKAMVPGKESLEAEPGAQKMPSVFEEPEKIEEEKQKRPQLWSDELEARREQAKKEERRRSSTEPSAPAPPPPPSAEEQQLKQQQAQPAVEEEQKPQETPKPEQKEGLLPEAVKQALPEKVEEALPEAVTGEEKPEEPQVEETPEDVEQEMPENIREGRLEAATDVEPEAAEVAQPEVTHEGKPEVMEEGKPEVMEEGKPEVTQEGKPEVTQEGKPEVTLEGKPEVTLEGKPEVTQEGKPEVTQEGKPEVTEEGKLEEKQGILPEFIKGALPEQIKGGLPEFISGEKKPEEATPDSRRDSAFHEPSGDTEEFFHHAPLPAGIHSAEEMQSEEWRRENMPSIPLERKSPVHHDVVEEGILHEVLPELEDESQLGTGGDAGLDLENVPKPEETRPETAEEVKPEEIDQPAEPDQPQFTQAHQMGEEQQPQE